MSDGLRTVPKRPRTASIDWVPPGSGSCSGSGSGGNIVISAALAAASALAASALAASIVFWRSCRGELSEENQRSYVTW